MDKRLAFMKGIAELRTILTGMECAAGVSDLSQPERDVLFAAHSAARSDVTALIHTDQIRNSTLTERLSQPTFQRALKSLVQKGHLRHAPGRKRGLYVLGQ